MHTGVVVIGVEDAPLLQGVERKGEVHAAVNGAVVHVEGGGVGQGRHPHRRAVFSGGGVGRTGRPGDVVILGQVLDRDGRQAPVVGYVRCVGGDDHTEGIVRGQSDG